MDELEKNSENNEEEPKKGGAAKYIIIGVCAAAVTAGLILAANLTSGSGAPAVSPVTEETQPETTAAPVNPYLSFKELSLAEEAAG